MIHLDSTKILTDPDDEILLVDYNTPDDYPTYPNTVGGLPPGLWPGRTRSMNHLDVLAQLHEGFQP